MSLIVQDFPDEAYEFLFHAPEIHAICEEIHKMIPVGLSSHNSRGNLNTHIIEIIPLNVKFSVALMHLTTENLQFFDILRSKDTTVPYSDPKLFDKVENLVWWVNPKRDSWARVAAIAMGATEKELEDAYES